MSRDVPYKVVGLDRSEVYLYLDTIQRVADDAESLR
jgi:hypothetical protein